MVVMIKIIYSINEPFLNSDQSITVNKLEKNYMTLIASIITIRQMS